jgi:hypothetical protein
MCVLTGRPVAMTGLAGMMGGWDYLHAYRCGGRCLGPSGVVEQGFCWDGGAGACGFEVVEDAF